MFCSEKAGKREGVHERGQTENHTHSVQLHIYTHRAICNRDPGTKSEEIGVCALILEMFENHSHNRLVININLIY